MTYILVRYLYFSKFTIGKLWSNNNVICDTLEPPLVPPAAAPSSPLAIPAGKYPLSLSYLSAFKMSSVKVNNVSGRDGIFFHPGNYPHDTKGCVLVGQFCEKDLMLIKSRQIFFRFLQCFLYDLKFSGAIELEVFNNTPGCPAPPLPPKTTS